jgi:hypothetical protein
VVRYDGNKKHSTAMNDATPKKIERKPLILPFMNELAKSSLMGIDFS